MFINPKIAIEEGWISNIKNPDKQIQPNAIDFTLDLLHYVGGQQTAYDLINFQPMDIGDQFVIDENHKTMKETSPYSAHDDGTGQIPYWSINPHSFYDGTSDMYVKVPEGVAAMLVTRSTLIRNGLLVVSGLYDSGFEGHIGFVIHNHSQMQAKIGEGTRVGQIIFVRSDSAGVYAGQYNHGQDTHWTEKGESANGDDNG